jgi:hypothetical protein
MPDGNRTLEDNIRRLEEATERCRKATKEANSATKQAQHATKELKQAHDMLFEGMKKLVDEAIEREVKAGLESYTNDIKRFTENAHEAVIQAFTKLSNTLIYGNEDGEGEPVSREWLRQLVQIEIRKMMI